MTAYTVRFKQLPSGAWMASSADIIGLMVYGKTLPEAMAEVAASAPELMRLNGQLEPVT